MDRNRRFRLAAMAGATALMIYGLDRRVDEEYGVRQGSVPLRLPDAMTRVGEFYDNTSSLYFTLGAVGGAALAGAVNGNRGLVETAGIALESVGITKLITQVFKRSIGRSRPIENSGPREFFPLEFAVARDRRSMPSGHTSSAFALASVFASRYPSPYIAIPLYGFAASVAMQRIDSRSHWLSDVFVGGALGTLVGRSLVRRHGGPAASKVVLVPSVGGGRYGTALVIRL